MSRLRDKYHDHCFEIKIWAVCGPVLNHYKHFVKIDGLIFEICALKEPLRWPRDRSTQTISNPLSKTYKPIRMKSEIYFVYKKIWCIRKNLIWINLYFRPPFEIMTVFNKLQICRIPIKKFRYFRWSLEANISVTSLYFSRNVF